MEKSVGSQTSHVHAHKGSFVSYRISVCLLVAEQVLPDIEEAGDHDGRAHPDDGGLVHQVHSGAEDGLPATAALHPVAHLKRRD